MHDNYKDYKSWGKWKLLPASWRYQAKEFFQKSTLHGVRYIAESERPIYERFMWFTLTTLGSVITFVIILSLWEKFQTNPTITGLDTDFHNWDVPFPAVTLCPHDAVNDTLLSSYVESKWGKNLGEEKNDYYKKFIQHIALLSYNNIEKIFQFDDDNSLPQDNLKDILREVKLSCEDLIENCQWKDMDYNCCEGFLAITTENGFCYTFNNVQAQFALIGGIPKVQYIYETDSKWALSFNLKTQGKNPVKLYIHSSEEIPSMDMDPQLVWVHQISKVFFSSKHTYTTDDARQLTIKQRRCIFPEERKLVTHTVYTYSACMTQCRMEKAKSFCGCVPIFYKKISGFPYCDIKGLVCLAKHKKDLGRGLNCPCELGCENTVYEVEKLVDSIPMDGADEPLEVGFVSWPMVRYKREVLFGWVDLLVSFGGIAGLFLGFSILTGVEIIYFFTMRAFCMVYRNIDDLIEFQNENVATKKKVNFVLSEEKRKKKKNISNNWEAQIRKRDEIFTIPYLD